jgi:hypothetical protein
MRRSVIWMIGLLLLGLPMLALAQAAPTAQGAAQPTLDDVLNGVHRNFQNYVATLPSLFADEHMVASASVRDANMNRTGMETTFDSIFRLKRPDDAVSVGDPAKANVLIESRQIQEVDHHPAQVGQALEVPAIITNAFSYGGAFMSPALKQCYDYRLEGSRKFKSADGVVRQAIVVSYELRPIRQGVNCPTDEKNSGRAFIDPATMAVLRMEQRRPEHPLTSGSLGHWGPSTTRDTAPPPSVAGRTTGWTDAPSGPQGDWAEIPPGTTGVWTWSIDYVPVTLNGKVYWLPKTIRSTTLTTTGKLFDASFVANYAHYHLQDVSVEILSGYKADAVKK